MASFFPDIVGNWSDSIFTCNFRVSRDTFEHLCSKLQPLLGKRYVVRKPILVQQRVAMTLWGKDVEYRTISHLFEVGFSSACAIRHEVCEAIVTTLGHKYIRTPQGNGIQKIMDGFLTRWQFPQCAGAVDGTHIPILAPSDKHTDYFNQKGFYSVVLQTFVDCQ